MAASRQEIDLIVEAITKGFDKVVADMGKVEKSTKKSGDAAKSSGLKWTELKSGLDLAQQAYGKIAQAAEFAYASVKEGAQLNLARDQFDNLAASIGTTADALLTDLKQATNGMQSDAELIAGATDIINLGLADTQESTVRLATAVSTLGLDMQQVILTFANNSKARLDALGLSVSGVTEKAAELEAQGFAGDAFDEAVLIGLEEKMTLLGDASETTAGQLQILESDWKNLTDGLKQAAAEMAGPTVHALVSNKEAVAALTRAAELGVISQGELNKALLKIPPAGQRADDVMEEYADVLAQADIVAARSGRSTIPSYTAALEAATAAVAAHARELTDARVAQAGADDDFNDKQMQIAASQAAYNKQLEEGIVVSHSATGATEEQTAALEEAARAEEEAAAAAKEHAASLGDLFRAAIDSEGGIGLYNETAAEMAETSGEATINQEALNQAIFDSADAQGASAEQLAILGGALGLYSDEAVEAALKSALIQAKIDELTASFLENGGSVEDLRGDILDFVASLDEIPDSVSTDVNVSGVSEASAQVSALAAQLNSLGGQVSAADAAGAGQTSGGDVFAAGGADFVVPPGFPNDSFGPIWAQSGEHVSITPPGQNGGGGNGVNQVNNFYNATDPNATASAVAEKLGKL